VVWFATASREAAGPGHGPAGAWPWWSENSLVELRGFEFPGERTEMASEQLEPLTYLTGKRLKLRRVTWENIVRC
jgi:hypothetical protein